MGVTIILASFAGVGCLYFPCLYSLCSVICEVLDGAEIATWSAKSA